MDSVFNYLNEDLSKVIEYNVLPNFPKLEEFNTIVGHSPCDKIRIQLCLGKINNVDPYQKFYDFFTTMDPSNLTPFMDFCGMINELGDKVPILNVFLSSNLVSHNPTLIRSDGLCTLRSVSIASIYGGSDLRSDFDLTVQDENNLFNTILSGLLEKVSDTCSFKAKAEKLKNTAQKYLVKSKKSKQHTFKTPPMNDWLDDQDLMDICMYADVNANFISQYQQGSFFKLNAIIHQPEVNTHEIFTLKDIKKLVEFKDPTIIYSTNHFVIQNVDLSDMMRLIEEALRNLFDNIAPMVKAARSQERDFSNCTDLTFEVLFFFHCTYLISNIKN